MTFTADPARLRIATSSTSRRTCRPTTAGSSDLAGARPPARAGAGQYARRCRRRDPEPGAARLHPRPPARRTPALLSGRDAGVRPRRRARHQAGALHRRLRRAAEPLPAALDDVPRGVRLPDPADALRERRTRQDLDQLLPGRLGHASPIRWPSCASASAPTGRRSRRRCKLDRRIGAYSYLAPGLGLAGGNLERDLATVLRFSRGVRHRGRRDSRLRRQQRAPPGLGAAHAARGGAVARAAGAGSACSASPTRRTPIR